MSTRKAMVIAALICALISIFYFFSGGNRDLEQSQEAFITGNNDLAREKLFEARHDLPASEYFLYLGYILRELQKYKDSTFYLQKALENTENTSSAQTLEIILNQILNSYLVHDSEGIERALKQAQNISPENSWVLFFQGLGSYIHQNYQESCAIWKKVKHYSYLSKWMAYAFEKEFPPIWHSSHIFRCEIEDGDYLDARQALEKEIQTAKESQLNDLYFLMGLSYAREAQQKPPSAALPYFKQAFSYFNRIPIDEQRFYYEKIQIVNEVQNDALKLIEMKAFKDLPFYIDVLEKWGAESELKQLTQRLIEGLNQQISEKNWNAINELIPLLFEAVPTGTIHDQLEDQFEKLLFNSLDQDDFNQVTLYWEAARKFSRDPNALQKRISKKVEQKILVLIPSDDEQLIQTLALIQFWKTLEHDHQRRYQLARDLIELAGYLWSNNRANQKALKLMIAASQLPYINEQKLLQPLLEQIFSQLYTHALQEDRIEELGDILEAIKIFNLKTVPINDKLQQGNHLADARFLYQQKRYAEAERKARWVYQINPMDPNAAELVGLIDFQKGEYPEALSLLKKWNAKAVEVEKAIAISEYLSGNIEDGLKQLKKLEASRSLDRQDYLTLGYGELIKGKPQQSGMWFQKISPKDNEVYAGEAFAAFQLKLWEKSIELFHQLTPPYNTLDSLRGMAILSFMALGQNDNAEEILNNLLKQRHPSNEDDLSPAFRTFKDKALDQIQREAVVAKYYSQVRKDQAQALTMISQTSHPTLSTLLTKAKILLSKGDIPQALEVIELAAKHSQGIENGKILDQDALPIMAEIYSKMGFYPEAAKLYQQLFLIDNPDEALRDPFSKVWMKLGRYDLALQELNAIKKIQELTEEEELAMIQSKINLNQFPAANEQAMQFLSKTPLPSLLSQLELARLLIISKNSEQFTRILQKVPDFNRRSLDENIAVINLWIDLGEYEKAIALSQRIQQSLEANAEGLLVLARLNKQLSDPKKAIEQAQKALELDGGNLEAEDLISQLTDEEWQIKYLEDLDKRRKEDPESVTLLMKILDTHLRLYQGKKNMPSKIKSSDLANDLTDLQSIILKNQEFPRLFTLHGKLYAALDNPDGATKVLLKALELNAADTEAAKELAKAYLALNEVKNAYNAATHALKFNPHDAESWEILASISMISGNHIDAINFLQNAIKFTPNNPLPYVNLALIYLEIKNLEGAQNIMEKAVSLDPENAFALKALYIILNDPDLLYEEEKEGVLEKRRREVIEKLKTLDPKTAEELESKTLEQKD